MPKSKKQHPNLIPKMSLQSIKNPSPIEIVKTLIQNKVFVRKAKGNFFFTNKKITLIL